MDIHRCLPDWKPDVLFDVGANKGQTAIEMMEIFPDARIYCFEPVPETFNILSETLSKYKNITCHPFALGSHKGVGTITANGTATGNSFQDVKKKKNLDTADVEIIDGDTFCAKEDIKRISYLKIDTEGYDLNVILGLHSMIATHNIDLIQVEASMSPENKRHIDISSFRGYLEPHGYYISRIHDQVREKKSLISRRANIIFTSKMKSRLN
jgi:FkbM family methyltransferase